MDDLTMALTCVKFHPIHTSVFAASTSRGTIHLLDLRQSSRIDTTEVNTSQSFSFAYSSPPRGVFGRNGAYETYENMDNFMKPDSIQKLASAPMSLEEAKGYFFSYRNELNKTDGSTPLSFSSNVMSYVDPASADMPPGMADVVSSISDISFSPDGDFIFARDYLGIKVWDVRKKSEPVAIIRSNEYIRPLVSSLYEMNCTFDKFDLCVSPNGDRVFSGSYNNRFSICSKTSDAMLNLKLPSKSALEEELHSNSGGYPPSPSSVPSNGNVAGSFSQHDVANSYSSRRNSVDIHIDSSDSEASPRSFMGKFQSSVSDLVMGFRSLTLPAYIK